MCTKAVQISQMYKYSSEKQTENETLSNNKITGSER